MNPRSGPTRPETLESRLNVSCDAEIIDDRFRKIIAAQNVLMRCGSEIYKQCVTRWWLMVS